MTYTTNFECIRTCCLTRKRHERKNLFRINVTKDKVISLDLEFNQKGRGYYIYKDLKIIERSKKALPGITKLKIDD